eukprot:GHVR01023923.1.p2 GENE.GHVR01023923.1~~GHVR01023923.1.p2  ORF type:complete len:104 (+),score=29.01 GHVR01023923.1:305-616(+)
MLLRKNYKPPHTQAELLKALQLLDPHSTGRIGRAELRDALCSMTESLEPTEADIILNLVPADENNKIDYGDLSRMYVCLYVNVSAFFFVYMCVGVCVYVCIYI